MLLIKKFFLLSVFLMCPVTAGDSPDPADGCPGKAQFLSFVNLRKERTNAQGVEIAIVEGNYTAGSKAISVSHVSPSLECQVYSQKDKETSILDLKMTVAIEDIRISNTAKPKDLKRLDLEDDTIEFINLFNSSQGNKFQNTWTKMEQNNLGETFFKIHNLETASTPMDAPYTLSQILITDVNVTELPSEDKGLVVFSPEFDKYRDIISKWGQEALKLEKKRRDLIRKNEKKYCNHARLVLKSFLTVAPGASIKMFSLKDLAKIAADPDINIVNFSCYELKNAENDRLLIDATTFDVFNRTGKILILALRNDHLPYVENSLEVLHIINRARGYYPIVCSASSYFCDDFLANVGDYLKKDDDIELRKSYITAPGFYIDFLGGDKPHFGCSISAPFVSAAAALLKASFPKATNEQIKNALIEGGRKSSDTDIIVSKDPVRFLSHVSNHYSIQLEQNWEQNVDGEYARVINLLENEHFIELDRAVRDPLITSHIWGTKDHLKYYNHLDIEKSHQILGAIQLN